MRKELTVILDDRMAPAASVVAALGPVSFSDILRRRRTIVEELTGICRAAGADRIEHLTAADDSAGMIDRIRERGEDTIYLRLPLCLAPLKAEGLGVLVEKAGYALETMLASAVMGDEAVAVLTHGDAAALIEAASPAARRTFFLHLRDRASSVTDHADFVDIRAPRNLMLYLSGATELRHFNAASTERGVFHKQSADIEKMRGEHGFFHAAPPEVQRFLLPTFGFWEDGRSAGYRMEHLAIPDAALQWVHGAFDAADFGALLDQIFAFLAARPAGTGEPAAMRALAQDQIVGKLGRRLDDFLETGTGRKVDSLLADAGSHGGLRAMQARAVPLIERALGASAAGPLVFSHGDPCFSNILYDRRLGLMRLVDPRGALAREDALMHPLYDLAKVSHSVLGGYDFVNNGLFGVQLDEKLNYRLDWTVPAPPDWAGQMFRDRVAAEGHDIAAVRAVELSLFLSMLPLHADHPDKLMGFALIAGRILDEIDPEGGR